ncbi:MAG: DUF1064 domain-containing protein [Candidatus Omnitrophica bacterium]|nr:DUF1064 domain-containing protein [Candidatus Omnitrophota bacterium]
MNLSEVENSSLSEDAKRQILTAFSGSGSLKPSKMRNKITTIDGIKFRSKREGKFYCDLKVMKNVGEVVSFSMQVPFIVGIDIRYYLDYKVHFADGRIEYWDVKPREKDNKRFTTPLYKLKKQLMKRDYGIEIIEK